MGKTVLDDLLFDKKLKQFWFNSSKNHEWDFSNIILVILAYYYCFHIFPTSSSCIYNDENYVSLIKILLWCCFEEHASTFEIEELVRFSIVR